MLCGFGNPMVYNKRCINEEMIKSGEWGCSNSRKVSGEIYCKSLGEGNCFVFKK